MKKMLLTLTTIGVLAVPARMAFAQTDTTEPAAPVPTCVDPVQERDRDRDRSADTSMLGDQLQLQLRTNQHEQLLFQDGTCDAECTGDQTRMLDQDRLADGTGPAAEHQAGGMAGTPNGRGNG